KQSPRYTPDRVPKVMHEPEKFRFACQPTILKGQKQAGVRHAPIEFENTRRVDTVALIIVEEKCLAMCTNYALPREAKSDNSILAFAQSFLVDIKQLATNARKHLIPPGKKG